MITPCVILTAFLITPPPGEPITHFRASERSERIYQAALQRALRANQRSDYGAKPEPRIDFFNITGEELSHERRD